MPVTRVARSIGRPYGRPHRHGVPSVWDLRCPVPPCHAVSSV